MFENHRKSLIEHCVRKKLIKNAKNTSFWPVFENLKHAVKNYYQTSHFQKNKNWWEMAKLTFSNATF